jgi:DEAD/DEAH box helicase domain-containing protein
VGKSYTIFERETGQAIGTIDGLRAFTECHPGAVYLHRAKQYLVDHLDLEKKDVIAHETDLKYFTRVRTEKETEVIQINRAKPEGQFLIKEGRLKVTEHVVGFEKRALPGQDLIGVFELDLPPHVFETMGFWVEIEPPINRYIEEKGLRFMGGIHAIEHGTIGMFPLFALCDRDDIGGIAYAHHPQIDKSAIFIYDGHPGGVGLAQRGFEVILPLFERTLRLLKDCECEEGCPSCIHSPKCGSGNKPLDKEAAVGILEFLLGHISLSQFYDQEDSEEPTPFLSMREVLDTDPAGPRVVYFDLETQKTAQDVGGWQNSHLMRVSVAVIYDSLEERFFSFTEDKIDDLLERLEKADLVVGFNVKRFDYVVLSAYTGKDFEKLNTFDILEDIHRRLGFRLGLDHLAKETLDQGKSAHGLMAVEWFRNGEMDKLTKYCEEDVAITRDLFLHGLDNGHLVYKAKKNDTRLRLLVDWKLDELIEAAKTED